jgi:3-hydroxyacyl-CoA dehydrogenase
MASPVSYALDGEVAVITIDNPPVNALSHAVREGLLKAVERFQGDSKAKAAVICRGRADIYRRRRHQGIRQATG